MNILVIAAVWPEPASSAAGRRMMDLIYLFQQQGWLIDYACTAGPSDFSVSLDALHIQQHSIAINDAGFDETLKQINPDVVLFDRFMLEEQFSWRVKKTCPTALLMMETSDLHCLRLARQNALKANEPFHHKHLNIEPAFRELASIQRTDLTLVISSYEMTLLMQYFDVPSQKLFYLPFLIDLESFKAASQHWKKFEERQHFVSIGNFKHPPNLDQAIFLKEQLWPNIRQHLPTAECHLYGAYPTARVLQMHRPKEGFFVHGRADNAQEIMQQARVCLAPLRFGAGLKGKLIEAMECGAPSVTTPVGAEGMRIAGQWPGRVEYTVDKLAEACVQIYSQPEHWHNSQKKIIPTVQALFDHKKFAQPLIDTICRYKKNMFEIRQVAFKSQAMEYHSLRASRFFSRWIEAKNEGANNG